MMESAIAIVTATVMAVGMATFLGYLGQKLLGAIILGYQALFASILSLIVAALGYSVGGGFGAWFGLLGGIILAGLWWARAFGKVTRISRSGRFVFGVWFGYCVLCILGFLIAGWVGLLTFTLPTTLFFWWGLYHISGHILPLHNPKDRRERHKAFRTLLTFTLGTNYPYYSVDEYGQPEKRVEGDAFRQFFAGPGFVVTNCEHVAYITSGVRVGGVFEPGLTFTGLYDLEPRIVDLRPQVRAFPVEALTKDGIPIEVVTFIPYRVDPGEQTAQLGQSFPFRQKAVHTLLARELVERKQDKRESGKRHEWEGGPEHGLIPLIGTPIMQDIISRYTVDELCACQDPERDPRVEIATELKSRAQEALEPLGLKLLGGGISNLIPKNGGIIERRLESWRTKWEGQILQQMSEAQVNRMYLTEQARAEVEVEIVELFRNAVRGNHKLDIALVLRFIDTLDDIFAAEGRWSLPNEELEQRLRHLRGESEEKKHTGRRPLLGQD